MPEFLSTEWLEALDAAARGSGSLAARTQDVTLTIQQVVHHAPRGETRYYMTIDRTGVRVRPGSTDSPDLTLIADYDVARAINAGTSNAQQALATGRLRIKGRLALLLGAEDVFATLDDVFAPVRGATTYEDGPTMPT
ncbi:MAG TPA: SCP2 sterol-binding domain-containing protein [Acidimicrobiia bacterium]|nr:SCP2 sterol-binding domain-containing protein [Acidimicrobiia bacterium]